MLKIRADVKSKVFINFNKNGFCIVGNKEKNKSVKKRSADLTKEEEEVMIFFTNFISITFTPRTKFLKQCLLYFVRGRFADLSLTLHNKSLIGGVTNP